MLVKFKSDGSHGNPVANFAKEMDYLEFAHQFASAVEQHPRLDRDAATGNAPRHGKVFAKLFGMDPAAFREHDMDGCSPETITFSPDAHVANAGNNKLAEVLFSGYIVYFRRTEQGLIHVPYAEDCYVTTSDRGLVAKTPRGEYPKGSVEFPWIAFDPQKFASVGKLQRLLTPFPDNPLTGLLESRDGAVRVLANMLTTNLRELRETWATEIANSF